MSATDLLLYQAKERPIIYAYSDTRYQGMLKVVVETTQPLPDNDKNLIINNLSKKLNKRIILEEQIKTNLIGGIIIKYEGKVIDGSLITNKQTLKEYNLLYGKKSKA